jgi:hypothetical protein
MPAGERITVQSGATEKAGHDARPLVAFIWNVATARTRQAQRAFMSPPSS